MDFQTIHIGLSMAQDPSSARKAWNSHVDDLRRKYKAKEAEAAAAHLKDSSEKKLPPWTLGMAHKRAVFDAWCREQAAEEKKKATEDKTDDNPHAAYLANGAPATSRPQKDIKIEGCIVCGPETSDHRSHNCPEAPNLSAKGWRAKCNSVGACFGCGQYKFSQAHKDRCHPRCNKCYEGHITSRHDVESKFSRKRAAPSAKNMAPPPPPSKRPKSVDKMSKQIEALKAEVKALKTKKAAAASDRPKTGPGKNRQGKDDKGSKPAKEDSEKE